MKSGEKGGKMAKNMKIETFFRRNLKSREFSSQKPGNLIKRRDFKFAKNIKFFFQNNKNPRFTFPQ